jgi:hypothetical protein
MYEDRRKKKGSNGSRYTIIGRISRQTLRPSVIHMLRRETPTTNPKRRGTTVVLKSWIENLLMMIVLVAMMLSSLDTNPNSCAFIAAISFSSSFSYSLMLMVMVVEVLVVVVLLILA